MKNLFKKADKNSLKTLDIIWRAYQKRNHNYDILLDATIILACKILKIKLHKRRK